MLARGYKNGQADWYPIELETVDKQGAASMLNMTTEQVEWLMLGGYFGSQHTTPNNQEPRICRMDVNALRFVEMDAARVAREIKASLTNSGGYEGADPFGLL